MNRFAPTCRVGAAVVIALGTLRAFGSAAIEDTESATHGQDAAVYQVVERYEFPGFTVVQIDLPVLSHYSYILESEGQAVVVDPGRDTGVYLEQTAESGAAIRGVILTHSHADFVAGHLELADATGCPVYVNEATGAEFDHVATREDTTLQVGRAHLRWRETPGHTLDGMCVFVYASQDSPGPGALPELIFTGDTLFVGSVGRPDLVVGTTSAQLAAAAYETWHRKLLPAGDNARVFPAHGAGSLCGAHLSDDPSSTIGREKVSNPYVQIPSRSEFVAAVLQDIQEPPQYFGHNARINREGPRLVDWDAPVEIAEPDDGLTNPDRFYVVDIRDAAAYAAGHIPNSVNIALRGRLETWTGIMVPWGSNVVLCGDSDDLTEGVSRLHRIGYHALGIAFESWTRAGQPLATSSMIAPPDLHAAMQAGTAPVIVDVRLPTEWMGLRIGAVLNLPLNHLGELSAKLNPADPVVTVCNSAYRSSMAVGILERRGFADVASLAGGGEAWLEAGLPVLGAETAAGPAPAPRRIVRLPDRISPDALRRMMLDLPGAFDLVDIRPSNLFADFSLPGSRNVDIADLVTNPAFLTGAGPLVVVDRDGSLAMAVAGILSQKGQREIKALHGGLDAYWQSSAFGGFTPAAPSNPVMTPPQPSAAPAPPAPATPAAPATTPPKKRSAGC